MNATDQPSQQADVKPTIVLVHGAFADASSWNGVIERLQQQGYTVIAPANPLRGVAFDSAYTASLLSQIDGPVLLGGHSYGGAIITNAAASAPNVAGLVYVAAFAPDEGENLGDVENGSKDSVLNAALVQYTYPAGHDGQTSVEFAINPARIREAFAADLPEQTTALMAATQRPIAGTCTDGQWRPTSGCPRRTRSVAHGGLRWARAPTSTDGGVLASPCAGTSVDCPERERRERTWPQSRAWGPAGCRD